MPGLERRRKLGLGKDKLRRVNSVPMPVLQMKELGVSRSQGSWPQDQSSKQWFDHSQARAMQASSPLSSPLGMAGLRYTVKVSVCTGWGGEVWEHSLIMSPLGLTPRRCLLVELRQINTCKPIETFHINWSIFQLVILKIEICLKVGKKFKTA